MFAYTEGPFPYHLVLLFSLLFGVLGGLFYECFRMMRTALQTVDFPKRTAFDVLGVILLFLQDLLFFWMLSVAAVLFLFVFNRGQLRLSMLLSMLFGFWFYYCTLGKLLCSLHEAVLGFLARTWKWVYNHTLRYLIVLLKYLVRISLGKVYLILKNACKRLWLRYRIYRAGKKLSLLIQSAQNGFENFSDHVSIG